MYMFPPHCTWNIDIWRFRCTSLDLTQQHMHICTSLDLTWHTFKTLIGSDVQNHSHPPEKSILLQALLCATKSWIQKQATKASHYIIILFSIFPGLFNICL